MLNVSNQCNKMVNGITPLLLAMKAASAKCMELLVEVLLLNISHIKF